MSSFKFIASWVLSLFKHEQLRIGFVAVLLQQYDTRRELLSIGTLVRAYLLIFLAHTSQLSTQSVISVRSGCSISLIVEIPWLRQVWWETNTLFSCRISRTDVILWSQTSKSSTASNSDFWHLCICHLHLCYLWVNHTDWLLEASCGAK